MQFLTFVSAALAVLVSGAVAQDACIINCSTLASQETGCEYYDLSCACTDSAFQVAAANCLAANCTLADFEEAIQLEQTLCAPCEFSSSFLSGPPVIPSEFACRLVNGGVYRANWLLSNGDNV
ncbi:hypothetical protein FISHEDRAFT_57741 [Fistulina hepatica ATCC 64428]|uniref:CFEM domain-containing protein n=1 Tax=Fistulina hepatica ATCC 64428 TaxID=1128425 RepID=A0A0D7AI58_9AGAR|nr:hypothetical protein FISHEDRAFT_57741 [Fistulina hepatica ATCC 64428]